MIKFKIIFGEEGYFQSKDFRNEVLSGEMNYPENKDDFDEKAYHIIGRENDVVMCYGRLYETSKYTFSIDKVCVNKEDRMQYVGDTILRALEDRAVSLIGAIINIKAPKDAWEFFLHEDYHDVGEEFIEDGVTYKMMKKDLTKVRGCRGGCKK